MGQSKNKIIKEVVQIILRFANPERIYLYGSQITGEANNTSDINIAYDDVNFSDNYLILEEVDKIETLTKIDVQNLSKTNDRFKNRVKSTGKVLYSATVHLRANDGLYNFIKALDKYIEIVDSENKFNEEGFGDIYIDILVKRFEFTYETAWKSIKCFLVFLGIEAKNPRAVFKEAYAQGIIANDDIWLDMIEQRNLSSHIYDEYEIKKILNKKDNYKIAFVALKNYIENALKDK